MTLPKEFQTTGFQLKDLNVLRHGTKGSFTNLLGVLAMFSQEDDYKEEDIFSLVSSMGQKRFKVNAPSGLPGDIISTLKEEECPHRMMKRRLEAIKRRADGTRRSIRSVGADVISSD